MSEFDDLKDLVLVGSFSPVQAGRIRHALEAREVRVLVLGVAASS